MSKDIKNVGIGLALGGGGVRGYAHVGVLRCLEENKIPINFIAGTSMGAIVGALYAKYKNVDMVEEILTKANWRDIFGPKEFSLQKGLIKGDKLEKYLDEVLEETDFGGLKIPFKAVATDCATGEKFEIMEGKVAPAVRASAGFPLAFEPFRWGDNLLYDGGMSDPVPVRTCRTMSDIDLIIAVNLDNKSCFSKSCFATGGNIYSLAEHTIQNVQYNLAKEVVASADIVIEPEVGQLGILDLKDFLIKNLSKIIWEGEKACRQEIPKIKSKMKIQMSKSKFQINKENPND